MLGIVGRTGVGTVVLWMGGLTVFFARGEVNVARGKSYSQSSTYNKEGVTQTGPDAAANGDTSGHYPANCICTREDEDHYKDHPWYEVNLGRTYPLYKIDIWARTYHKDRLYPSTITVDGQTCSSVTSFGSSGEKRVKCSAIMYGQRVRITLNKTTESLNLCEMEIWVPDGVSQCPAGKYGSSCDLDCSENCGQGPGKNFCDQSSAKCYGGCVAGWYGDQCSTACSPGCANQQCSQESGECSPCNTGYTGDTCTDCQDNYYQTTNGTCASCSSNCQSQSCASPTGRCNGCVDSRYGEQCDRMCPAANCQQCEQDTGECTQCALDSNLLLPDCTDCLDNYYERPHNTGCDKCTWSCQSGTVCDKTTGHCPVCPPGQQGHQCDEDCEPGRYGQNCTGQCGHCLHDHLNDSCEAVTGNCTYSCQDGWLTTLCDEECADGRWGADCVKTCAQCRDGGVCRKDDGRCPVCEPGWYPPLCDTPCQEGWYGDSCSQQCGMCKDDAICNRTTGHCPDCTIGRQPPLCHADCQNKTYGQNCVQTCGQCRGGQPCDPVTGQCSNGCRPGWTDLTPSSTPLCQTECPVGYYGEGCNQTCGYCRVIRECRHDTGHCTGQCAEGFTGSLCTERDVPPTDKQSAVIIGSTVGAGLFFIGLCVIVVGVVWARRFRKTSSQRGNRQQEADTRTSNAPSRPVATAERGQTAPVCLGEGLQHVEDPYENLEDVAMTASAVHPGSSALHDIKVHEPDVGTTNFYDGASNAGVVHLYE